MRPKKVSFIITCIFFVIFANSIPAIAKDAGKICYSCSPDYTPGSPVSGNKSLSALALLSRDLLSRKDNLYLIDLDMICKEFYDEDDAEATLKKQTIPSMLEATPNQKIEGAFLEDGCIPRKIGGAFSPIAHLAAELPVGRLDHLKAIKNYFTSQGKTDFFKSIINAKNTLGYSTLDYVQYMIENRNYSKEYEVGINAFIKYLCDNGGEYSIYKSNKKCDGKLVVIK